jgi:hypothetical protein
MEKPEVLSDFPEATSWLVAEQGLRPVQLTPGSYPLKYQVI